MIPSNSLSPKHGERIRVALAIIANERGEVLITRRHPLAHQGGLWEFPGGKLESGEEGYSALCREVEEETGLQVRSARPLIWVPHDYGDRRVSLEAWRITRWRGTPEGREGQAVAWVSPEALRAYPFPPANGPIIAAISLPDTYLITPEPDWNGLDGFLDTLDGCLARGVRLVQLRVKGAGDEQLTRSQYGQLAREVLRLCEARGARCLLNAEPSLAREMGMHGAHLTSRRLLDGASKQSDEDFLIGASCHNRNEIEQACRIGADFCVLAPVKATATHPGAPPLTWAGFAPLAHSSTIPVYALGGLSPGELEMAWRQGAQGIAAIRALWRNTDPPSPPLPGDSKYTVTSRAMIFDNITRP